jgi:hypothetical protein
MIENRALTTVRRSGSPTDGLSIRQRETLRSGWTDASGQEPLGVVTIDDADELALRCRDDDRRHAGVPHPLVESAEFLASLDGRRAQLHEVRCASVVFLRQILPPNPSKHDALLIHHNADGIRTEHRADVARRRVGEARGRRRGEHLARDVPERTCSLHREATLTPLRLAPGEIEHAGEAERFEPPRGSRTEVSEVIVAVNDDRTIVVDPVDRFRRQLLQRDVVGAGKVLLDVLLARKDLEEESIVLADEPPCFIDTDIGWHPREVPICSLFERCTLDAACLSERGTGLRDPYPWTPGKPRHATFGCGPRSSVRAQPRTCRSELTRAPPPAFGLAFVGEKRQAAQPFPTRCADGVRDGGSHRDYRGLAGSD